MRKCRNVSGGWMPALMAAALLMTGWSPLLAGDEAPRGWKVVKSRHFEIYAESGVSDSFLSSVESRSEDYYEEITEEFGFRRSEYWTWDNRAKIYIFNDHASYVKGTGNPSWSGGVAHTQAKEIYTFAWASNFLDNLLPHELTHVIFREFTDKGAYVPPWFNEGIAVYQERDAREEYKKTLDAMALSNATVPFEQIWGAGPGNYQVPHFFYAQAASMIDYLLHRHNSDYFLKLVDKLCDRVDFTESFLSVYGYRDLQDFNQSWLSYVKSNADPSALS